MSKYSQEELQQMALTMVREWDTPKATSVVSMLMFLTGLSESEVKAKITALSMGMSV